MKKNRQANSLPVSNSRWLGYATAGAATALGGIPRAEAEIHYSGELDQRLAGVSTVLLPLSNGASLLFRNFDVGSGYPAATFFITGAVSGSARAYQTETRYPTQPLSNLKTRIPVSTGRFGSVLYGAGRGEIRGFSGTGEFNSSGIGIIGFRFNIGNGAQYGWARIKVSAPRFLKKYRYMIKDYAWGDVGDSIETGQRRSTEVNVSAVPDSGSLGLLALGGVGLQAWRESRVENKINGR
jgi:hypothetical protein